MSDLTEERRGIESGLPARLTGRCPSPKPTSTTPSYFERDEISLGSMPGYAYLSATFVFSLASTLNFPPGFLEGHRSESFSIFSEAANTLAAGKVFIERNASLREVCIFLTFVPKWRRQESSDMFSCMQTKTPEISAFAATIAE